jgi:hypothetical protein
MTLQSIIDKISGLVFGPRKMWLVVFAIITVVLGYFASQLRVDAGFNKMIPLEHPYMKVFTQYQKEFGGANRILIALVRKDGGDIFSKEFFEKLKKLSDEVFVLPGVDKPSHRSLFSPAVRFIEVIEEGFAGGNIIPATFQGTPADLEKVRENLQKSSEVGRLVTNDFKGALVRADLLEIDPSTNKRLNYFEFAAKLEELRGKYQDDKTSVHIIGFAKAVGDISDGAKGVLVFFGFAFIVTVVLLQLFSKNIKLTAIALFAALMPVLWLFGMLTVLGFGIDPLSILVPFLIFSIGVSHAVQMTKNWEREAAGGLSGLEAAKAAFARLFIPGTLALLTNVLGFAVIMLIKIDIVRELGITASVGVGLMIITNKMLLPILLSYVTLDKSTLQDELKQEGFTEKVWNAAARFADRRHAVWVILASIGILALGLWQAQHLKVGDLGEGLPELRETSRYNQDNAVITQKFSIGVDVLGVIAQTKGVQGACTNYDVMNHIEKFAWFFENLPGVQSVISLPGLAKGINAGFNEGNLKWRALPRDPQVMAQSVTPIDTATGLLNPDCSAMQLLGFTSDHQGATIAHIVAKIKKWTAENKNDKVDFLLATGNVGVMAATNEAVKAAEFEMHGAIFGALFVMCMLTFRSLGATLCILLPLALVSVLNNALMATFSIGLKVSTLPVIALGVGVGVDYGIYLFDRIEAYMHEGGSLAESFFLALTERGAAMIFTAVTMTIGVGSWAFSALKLQADMGILLAFMFFLNMIGTITLLPALAAFLVKTKKLRSALSHPALARFKG